MDPVEYELRQKWKQQELKRRREIQYELDVEAANYWKKKRLEKKMYSLFKMEPPVKRERGESAADRIAEIRADEKAGKIES
jgi:hypothetical protein